MGPLSGATFSSTRDHGWLAVRWSGPGSVPRDQAVSDGSAMLGFAQIIFFVLAIARAWQMIGARGARVLAVVGDLLRDRLTPAIAPDNDD